MNVSRIFSLALMVLSALLTLNTHAANAILLWPINPKISHDEKAAELWMENRGDSTTLMQVRVFQWQQQNDQEQYQTQQQVMASPPMVRIEPGQKQLVRLIKQTPPATGQEASYRILLDEIPTPPAEGVTENHAGLNFQMRYSVPLFVYGDGLSTEIAKPNLSWHIVNQNGQQTLKITNNGSGHARLSHVSIGGRSLGSGLFGYILPHSTNTFPLSFPISTNAELSASLGDKQTWRSTSTSR